MIDITIVFNSIIAAAMYAVVWWVLKNVDPTKPSPYFDWYKLGSTVIIGAGVGLFAALYDLPLTQIGVEGQLVALAGITAVVENVLRTVWHYLKYRNSEVST